MCGICGMVGFANQDLLKKMCDVMKHRGPDDEGYYCGSRVAGRRSQVAGRRWDWG